MDEIRPGAQHGDQGDWRRTQASRSDTIEQDFVTFLRPFERLFGMCSRFIINYYIDLSLYRLDRVFLQDGSDCSPCRFPVSRGPHLQHG